MCKLTVYFYIDVLYSKYLFHLQYIYIYIYIPLNKVKQYVTSESAFFNAFIEEGLRFSSSLYLSLIWIHMLKPVFENPNKAAGYLKSHPFFNSLLVGCQHRPIEMDCVILSNLSV